MLAFPFVGFEFWCVFFLVVVVAQIKLLCSGFCFFVVLGFLVFFCGMCCFFWFVLGFFGFFLEG